MNFSFWQDGLGFDLSDLKLPVFLKKGESATSSEAKRRELQQQHENELTSIQIALKKAEKEIFDKETETNHYKRMTGDIAE